MEREHTILIVEDSTVNCRMLRGILEEEYRIQEAHNGAEALRILEKDSHGISAMILDLGLPVLDGYEVLEKLAALHTEPLLPILVATVERSPEVEERCLALGAWDFVSKPYNAKILKMRLSNIIGHSRMVLMERIRELAERDRLTGLYNRSYFMEKTRRLLRAHPEKTFALVRMDMDRFRLFNSFFGSAEGDCLLRRIAEMIRRSCENSTCSTYGRIESDVFCLCLPFGENSLKEYFTQLSEQARGLYKNYCIELSFGVYMIDRRETELETMYACATEAARRCKNQYNVHYTIYDASMNRIAVKAQCIVNEMENALREKQFVLYLQPKYALKTNLPTGAEVLVRWMHPERGMIMPGDFIPVFEQNGFIVQLDKYMWEQACMLLRRWLDGGHTPDPISVNVSRISLYDPHIVEWLEELVRRCRVPSELLNLEITESAYMENPALMKNVLARLRAGGFVIMMDDFGSGYSSLNTLKEFDIDILKVDMRFLPSGTNNARSEKILASVMRMAGWLGISVVVEGVETNAQKEFLDSIGCGYVQGYYFARPMSVTAYEELVDRTHSGAVQKAPKEDLTDLDGLWSSNQQIGALLKSILFPFVIYEYSDHHFEALRANDAFTREFGFMRTVEDVEAAIAHSEIMKMQVAFEQAVFSRENTECECFFVHEDGAVRWYRIRLQYIRQIENTHILGATYSEVTGEHHLENELDRIFDALNSPSDSKQKMLVVDDSELSRELLSSLFEDSYQILTAADGQQALELLKQNVQDIAVILLDMLMPRMNGSEFLSYKNQMRAAADIPVIVISAESNEKFQINMLKNGVNDYVTKPFVSQVVVRRVKNVMEYNSRFRTLVQEYNDASRMALYDRHEGERILYEQDSIVTLMRFMSCIFDVVRLVDPATTSVLSFDEKGMLQREDYCCFKVWGKDSRCENCTSQCAANQRCQMTKYEFIENDIFYVVSRPVEITLHNGEVLCVVLEIVSRVSDHLLMRRIGGKSVREMLEETQRKIYSDGLTGCYNRRYLDEMLFVHHGRTNTASRVAFVLFDMYRFKSINDTYGHTVGDQVLRGAGAALMGHVRSFDSVIRYGGDEFLVVLTEISEEELAKRAEQLRSAIAQVHYGPENALTVAASMGYAFTKCFDAAPETLQEMLRTADEAMYRDKRSMRHNEGETEETPSTPRS